MKKDAAILHKEKMHELHALFTKKMQYHNHRAYLELSDIYWLVHEFFSSFLGKDVHFTEQELTQELKMFKHEFISIDEALLARWHVFFSQLSHYQYSGTQVTQEHLKALLEEFGSLVDDTVGKERTPSDLFTQHLQTANIYAKNGDMDKAYEAYQALMAEYQKLPEEKKKLHYEPLEHLYQIIAVSRSA